MQYIGSIEAAEKHVSEMKLAHFCEDFAYSTKFSATIFGEPCNKAMEDLHRLAEVESQGYLRRSNDVLHVLLPTYCYIIPQKWKKTRVLGCFYATHNPMMKDLNVLTVEIE